MTMLWQKTSTALTKMSLSITGRGMMLSTWKLRHLNWVPGRTRPGFTKGWATAHQPRLNQNFARAAPIEKYSKPRQTPRNKPRDTSVVEQNCPPGHETHFRVYPLLT